MRSAGTASAQGRANYFIIRSFIFTQVIDLAHFVGARGFFSKSLEKLKALCGGRPDSGYEVNRTKFE